MTVTAPTHPIRPLRVFVVGIGQMGRSHAIAYHRNPAYQIVGLHNRTPLDEVP